MAVDERPRHELYGRLEATLGPEATGTIMELLPPVGWADVATRQDLAALENAIRADLHAELSGLRRELHTGMRTMLFGLLGAMFTLAGLTWGAVTLA